MDEKKEKIDLLFEKNAEEQLARVDWDELNAVISSRLDQTQQSRTSARKYPTVFKIAGGLVAAAAVVFIVLMVRTDGPPEMPGRAMVTFIEEKGSASVEIIDSNGDLKKDSDRASWIIISRPAAVYADNGADRDMSMIYLF